MIKIHFWGISGSSLTEQCFVPNILDMDLCSLVKIYLVDRATYSRLPPVGYANETIKTYLLKIVSYASEISVELIAENVNF